MQAPSFKDLGLGLTIGGGAAVTIGSFLMMDDVHDFPEVVAMPVKGVGKRGFLKGVDLSWLPPHIHHWLLGLILLLIGAILLLFGLVFLVKVFILKT